MSSICYYVQIQYDEFLTEMNLSEFSILLSVQVAFSL